MRWAGGRGPGGVPGRARLLAAVAALLLLVLAGCGGAAGGSGSASGTGAALVVAVDAPTSTDPATAGVVTRGADLAVKEINAQGGVVVGGVAHPLRLRAYDDAGDPQQAAANTASAIADGAVAIIEDGTGATISGPRTAAAGIPEIVVANGVTALGDGSLSSLFRLGIGNDAAASLLSTYIGGKHPGVVAIIHDDTADGRDGAARLAMDLPTAQATVGPDLEVAASAPTVDAQLATVVAAHAGALAIWGGGTFTARVLTAASLAGVRIPLYSGPAGESPTVRRLAGAAAEGLALVAARTTSESDQTSFGAFEHRLAAAEGGPIDAGVKDAAGEEVRQPADTDFYAYDAVRLVAAALTAAGSVQPGSGLLHAFTSVTVTSANGDHRGFRADLHEGIADDDLYIARIHDNRFEPVKDEPLSATLPVIDEVLSHFR